MKLIRSAVSVGLFTVLSRIFGFFREVLQAHLLGVSEVNDAIQLALRLPSLFRRLFAEGAFNSSFVPMFSRILVADGKKNAFDFAQQVLWLLTIVLVILTILVEYFLPTAIPLLFPGFARTPHRLQLTIEFTQITFPFLIFISLTAFYSGILNSFDRFILAASSPAAGNLIIIGALLYLTPYVDTPGHALAWGGLACGIVQFIWVMIPCRKDYFRTHLPQKILTPHVKKFLKILLPAALGSGVVQLNIFLDMMVASYLEIGGISYISYADRLSQLPLSVIGIAISTALLPMLSKQIRNKEMEAAAESQNVAIQFSLFLALPAMIGLMMMAPSLIRQIYYHGKFLESDIMPTAYTLMALASGLPAYVLNKVFATSFFSHGDSKTPMIIAAGTMMLNVILNILLLKPFKYVGLGLATSIAAWVGTLILGILLYRRQLFQITPSLRTFLKRVALSAVILAAYFWQIHPLWENWITAFTGFRLLVIWVLLMPPVVIFALCGYFLKMYTLQDIKIQFSKEKKPSLDIKKR